MKARNAILIGQLVINLPVTLIIIGVFFLGIQFNFGIGLSLFLGGVISWLYWSVMIPKWRNWAISKGVDKIELSKWGRWTLLTWKEGSIFEKTEFRPKDKNVQ